jgi:ParB-like chromosome segregation protein Spo0J
MKKTDYAKKGAAGIAARATRLERLVVEYVPIESIRPNSFNPNQQDPKSWELMLRSIQEDGFTVPIIVQRGSGEIVDGFHRWKAARHLNMLTVPVAYVDFSPEQHRIATLGHNRIHGSEDVVLSTQVLRDLRELGALDWAQDSLMIGDAELQRLLDDVPAPEALASESYSEGWTPTRDSGGEVDTVLGRSSSSEAAERANAELRRRVLATQDPDERARLEQESRKATYRVNLTFEAEEARVVRAVLDPRPAQGLLALCRAVELREQAGLP